MTGQELFAFVRKNPIGVVCGVLSLALVAGIYLRSGDIPDAEARLAEKSAQADRYAANIKNSIDLKEQLDAMTVANKAIETRLVHAASGLAVNQAYFLQVEGDSHVKSLEYRQQPLGAAAKSGKTAYIPVSFSVAVQGDLKQVMHFLRAVEGGAHYSRVNTASLQLAGARTSGLLTLSLNLDLLGLP